jgi:hypothetical protein
MRGHRRALIAILLLSLVANSVHLAWGLPNGNTSWAVDAITPLTPLSAAYKSITHRESGWFYFKYPLGHPLLLLGASSPYLAMLYVVDGWRPARQYPYGFADPERALLVLALIGRAVSVVMGTATVLVVFAVGATMFEPVVGLAAAATAAASLVLIFYAHTTNLDVPLTFWMLLAVLCAVRLMRHVRWLDSIGLGISAAMGFATKEAAAGMLVVLPALIAGAQIGRFRSLPRGEVRQIVTRLAAGVLITLAVYGVATNGFVNPAGMINRWRYLSGLLPGEFFGSVVPRPPYVEVISGVSLEAHGRFLRQLWSSMSEAVGVPLFTAGLCGSVIALIQAPRPTAALWLLGAAYYYVTLTALPLVTLRYVLPLAMLLAVFGGVFFVRLARISRAGGVVAVLLWFAGLAYGGSVDYLLVHDPRYAAEAWLEQHAVGRTVDAYSRPTYLPRMPAGVTLLQPAFEDVTIDGLARRRPDFIVLNMADIGHVTGRYDTVKVGVRHRPENQAFLRALLDGSLGYHPVARFHARSPLVRDGAIRSLNPEIVIFTRP